MEDVLNRLRTVAPADSASVEVEEVTGAFGKMRSGDEDIDGMVSLL
jgi:hypothetical protein